MHTLLSNVRGWEFTSANTAARRRSLVTFLGTLLAISMQMLLPAQAQRFGTGNQPSEPSVLDRLKWVHPHLVANDFLDVGYFPEVNETGLTYVAVGREGVVAYSPDAFCWQYRYVSDDLYNVTAGEIHDSNSQTYKFYAGSRQGQLAMYHVETRSWFSSSLRSAPRVDGNAVDLLGVAFGNSRLVVVTSDGYAGTTANTEDWQWSRALPTGMEGDLVSLAFRGGQWVAASTTNLIVYSRDGTNWFPSRIETPLKRVRAAAGGFVGVSTDERIGTSADGVFWSFVEKHDQGKANDISGFGGELVLVGDDSLLSSSATLKDWKKIGSSLLVTNLNFNAVTRNPAPGFPFVTVGDRGTILHYFSNTTKATSANNDILFDMYGVAYGEGAYAAVGLRGTIWAKVTGTNGALYSYLNEANEWTPRGSGITNDLTSIAFGKKRFVAVGGNSGVDNGASHATILTSPDTVTWTPVMRLSAIVDPGTSKKAYPKTVVFGGGRFVALAQGEAGAALISLDGNRWETQFNPILDGMRSIGYGNGLFIAVGDRIATSVDGFTWTEEAGVTGANLSAATGGNDIWVAVGSGINNVLVKTNGGTWKGIQAAQGTPMNHVIYAANHFVAVGSSGTYATSVDGIVWDERSSFGISVAGSAKFAQRGIVFGNNEYAVVGDRGDISVSPKVDAVTGLPAATENISSVGGSDQDSVNAMSFTGASRGEYYTVGAFRKSGRFGIQTLGDPVDPSPLPSFFLARHSDTGSVTFAVSGPLNSIGTHVVSANGRVIAGGFTFESAIPAEFARTAGGVGFVASLSPVSGYDENNCYQKLLTVRDDSLIPNGNWSRNFDGTLTDLKTVVDPALPFFPQVRFAGVFQAALDMGDSITIESTNTPRSFFLTKVDSFSGLNTWVRWFEPTNMAPNEPLYGLKLATDVSGNTIALGAISGGLNIFSNVPPDTGATPGAAATGARSGRPALADACPGGHSAESSALEGNPCEEACPPGHSPTLSTLLGSPCSDGGGGGNPDDTGAWKLVGKVPVTGHAPGLAMFVSIFDIKGAFVWAGNIGPVGSVPVAVEVDGAGNIYVAANKNDGSLFMGAYAQQGKSGLQNLWSKEITLGGGSQLTALHVRTNGLLMVAGTFQRSVTISEPDTFGSTNLVSGGTASFVLRVDPNGKIRSAHAVGTADEQSGFSVVNAIHSLSPTRAVLGGYFVQSAKFGSLQASSRGLGDGYVAMVELTDPPKPPPVPPSDLVITRTARGIKLEWTTDSILQRSTGLTPAIWTDIEAPSPVELGVGASIQCYRLRSK